MKKLTIAATAAAAFGASGALAGGLDRSGQDIGILFEQGTLFSANFAYVMPTISATNSALTENIAEPYTSLGFGFKTALTDQLDVALLMDEPFGANISYKGLLTGFADASLDTTAFTLLARYKLNENFSVHGGLRAQSASAEISLPAVAGYALDMTSDFAFGYSIGAAYEIPAIAARVAITYNSAITQTFTGTEGPFGGAASTFETETPQSVNVDFQTGIAEGTLLFGSVRWVDWSSFDFSPTNFPLNPLASFGADTFSGEIGIGRQFTDKLAASVTLGYEPATGGVFSDLGPTDGYWSIGAGAKYTFTESFELSGGVRYVGIGDANGGMLSGNAPFTDNSAIAIGMQLTTRF